MPERLDTAIMAMRVAREFQDGFVVNLGMGLPLLCCDYLPADREVLLHSEQGIVGFGPFVTEPERVDLSLLSPGGLPVSKRPGMTVMSHDESFALVRGGHLDLTVLGALQVGANGDLANTHRPGRVIGNLGGAQDLATCAKKVIVMMRHTTRQGEPKVLSTCTLPLTAIGCVDMIVTDVAVIDLVGGQATLREYAPGWTPEQVQAITAAPLVVAADVRELDLAG